MPTPRESFTNTVDRQGYSGARLQPADFGAAGEIMGKAAQNFGQDLKETAANIHAIQKDQAETNAQEAMNMGAAEKQIAISEFQGLQGKAATEAAPLLIERLKKIDEKIAGDHKLNPWARKMYDTATSQRNADEIPTIYKHATTQWRAHQTAVRSGAKDRAIDDAILSSDPTVISQSIATAGNIEVAEVMATGQHDPAVLEQARQKGHGDAIIARATELNRTSPRVAQKFVLDNISKMDPLDAAKTLTTLAPAAAQEGAYGRVLDRIAVQQGLAAPTPAAPADPLAPVPEGGGYYPEGPRGVAPAPPPPRTAAETSARLRTPTPPTAALDAAQFTGPRAQEGAQSHTNSRGQLISSPAGALGVTQVMVATGYSPGYGVRPLRNQSREEYMRFGRDYRDAMLKEYDGNIVLALTAYNWGPGRVNDHIKKVGNPNKGQISDAAWVNSIPVKEARNYAPAILQRTGISVSGGTADIPPTATTDPGAAVPPNGQDFDLPALIRDIEADPNLTYVDKQAQISAATSLHGQFKAAAAEEEDRVQDIVATEINGLGADGFTSYDKLTLTTRQMLEKYPRIAGVLQRQAQTTADNLQARREVGDAAARTAASAEADFAVGAMFLKGNPGDFQKINFVNPAANRDPRVAELVAKLSLPDRQRYMKYQTDRASQSPTTVDMDAVRITVTRMAGPAISKNDQRMANNLHLVTQKEQEFINREGRRPNPAERQAMVALVLMPARVVVDGEAQTMTRGEAQRAARRPGFGGADVDEFAQARATYILENNGEIPTPEEVQEIVRRTRARRNR